MVTLILKNRKFVIFFILAIAFFLRLYHLGYHDFWYDEIATLSYARYPSNNWDPPLHWIMLHFWKKAFGVSEFSLRFPSLIFSLLSVILTFFLGKELFNKKIGIVASIFIGFSPFHLWYAQEARSYSMVLFLGTLSSFLFCKVIKEGKLRLWALFILVSILGLYTNYLYIFLFLAQGLYLIFSKRFGLGFKETIYFLIIILGFSFYLPRFLTAFYCTWQGFWIPKPTVKSLIVTTENFILGYNGFFLIYLISDVLVGLFFISALWAITKKEFRAPFIFCIFLFSIPILLTFFFSRVFFSVYLDRGLIIFSPYLYLVLSLGIVSSKKWINRLFLITLILIFFMAIHRYYTDRITSNLLHRTGAFVKKPFKHVVSFIENKLEEEDIVAVTNNNPPIIPSLAFYSKSHQNYYFFFDPKIKDPNYQRPIIETKFDVPFYKINSLEFKNLWLIASDGGNRNGGLDANSLIVKDWLDKKYKLDLTSEFYGLWVFRYIRH